MQKQQIITADNYLNIRGVVQEYPIDVDNTSGGGYAVDQNGSVVTLESTTLSSSPADASAVAAAAPYTQADMNSWDCQTLATNLGGMKDTLNNGRLTQAGFMAYQQAISYASNLYNTSCQVVPQKPNAVDAGAGTVEPVPATHVDPGFPVYDPVISVQTATMLMPVATDDGPMSEGPASDAPAIDDKNSPGVDTMTPPAITPYTAPVSQAAPAPVGSGGSGNETAAVPAPTSNKNYFWYFVGITALAALVAYNKPAQ